MKKLMIVFPGIGYGPDCPLLYYGDFLFETKGYERIHVQYPASLADRFIPLEIRLEQLRKYEAEQLRTVDLADYEEIVFLSKSVGTVEAGWIAETLGLKVRQIFLTPLEEAMGYCRADSKVVIGTRDSAFPAVKTYCEKHQIDALYIEDADHALEIAGKPEESIEVLKKVIEFIS